MTRATSRSFLLHPLLLNLFLVWILLFSSTVSSVVSAVRVKSIADINDSKQRQRRKRTGSRRHLISVTSGTTSAEIASYLKGPGVTILNATMIQGKPEQMGVFTDATDSIGIPSGIVLSTGFVRDIEGPNKGDARTTRFNEGGYAPLDALVASGTPTYDAVVLQIEFVCDSGLTEEVHLQYVFASEEYNEYVDQEYNDVFGIFLDGLSPTDNVATLPDGTPVAINSVNCGNPYDAASTNPNCQYFVNNERSSRTTEYNIEFDGFTVPFEVNANAITGTNTITIAVADVGDDQFDSAVFVGEGSLICGPLAASTPPTTPATTTNVPTTAPPATVLPAPPTTLPPATPAPTLVSTPVVPATTPPATMLPTLPVGPPTIPTTTTSAPVTTPPPATPPPGTPATTPPATNSPITSLPLPHPTTPTLSSAFPTIPLLNTRPPSHPKSSSKSSKTSKSKDYHRKYYYCEDY